MPSILFVCLHRPERSPSQRFRFEQYINFLEKNGFSTRFSYLLDQKDDKSFYAPGKHIAKLRILLKSFIRRFYESFFGKKYDIVFVQRECFMLGTSFFERRFAKRSKLVFDFDDSIWLQTVSDANKKFGFLKNAGKTKEIIKVADLVIAGNQYLANYALPYNKNTVIIPTTIDTDLYKPVNKVPGDKVCIGWSGSFSTIAHFEYHLNALKKIKEKYGDRVWFKVIGDASYFNKELGIKGLAWKKETEVEYLQDMDIGIMPLPDDEWANGKCGLKGLQYMALEIATIMSPVGVNKEIIQDGVNGFLAGPEDEWVSKLSLLIESAELRARLGKNGRKTVEEKYSVHANKDLYLENLRSLAGRADPKTI